MVNQTVIIKNVTQQSGNGVSFLGLLFLVFLVLKLTGVIAWSWWWVTAPLWGGFALMLGIALLILLGVAIVFVVMGLLMLLNFIITRIKKSFRR